MSIIILTSFNTDKIQDLSEDLEFGDWKLLYVLSKNMEPLVFGEVLVAIHEIMKPERWVRLRKKFNQQAKPPTLTKIVKTSCESINKASQTPPSSVNQKPKHLMLPIKESKYESIKEAPTLPPRNSVSAGPSKSPKSGRPPVPVPIPSQPPPLIKQKPNQVTLVKVESKSESTDKKPKPTPPTSSVSKAPSKPRPPVSTNVPLFTKVKVNEGTDHEIKEEGDATLKILEMEMRYSEISKKLKDAIKKVDFIEDVQMPNENNVEALRRLERECQGITEMMMRALEHLDGIHLKKGQEYARGRRKALANHTNANLEKVDNLIKRIGDLQVILFSKSILLIACHYFLVCVSL